MFRFTIRDLLWVTALSAVLFSWWMDRGNWQQCLAESEKARSECQAALQQVETERAYVVGANKAIVDFLTLQGFSANLPEEVYLERPKRGGPQGKPAASQPTPGH